MYSFLKDKISYLYSTFHGSETILLARFNVAFGSLYAGLQFMDLTKFNVDQKWVMAWMIGNGALGEYLRRRKAEYSDDGSIK